MRSQQGSNRTFKSRAAMAAIFTASGVAGYAEAQSVYIGAPSTATFFSFNASTTGSYAANSNKWSNAAYWTAGVPNAVDALAAVQWNYGTEIEIDGNYTVGNFTFDSGSAGSSNAVTLIAKPTVGGDSASKSMTFAVVSGTPSITISQPSNSIFFYNTLKGNQGIDKLGPGRFTFRFNPASQSYTGGVNIRGGTFGIQIDGSLGDQSNNILLGATDSISGTNPTTAKLLAEPSIGTGTLLTLSASRIITLNGPGAQIGVNAGTIGFVIPGVINESGGSFGFNKTDGGILYLNGTNTYTGVTTVSGGTLLPATSAALPGFATPGKVNLTGGALVLKTGGAAEFTQADVGSAVSSATGTGGTIIVDTTNAAGSTTIVGAVAAQGFGIGKAGPNTLVLTGTNNFTGTVNISGGTLALGATGSLTSTPPLVFSGSGTLDLGGKAATFRSIDDGSGITAAVTNGTLTINSGSASIGMGGNSGQLTSFSGLSGLTIQNALNVGTASFDVTFQPGNNVTATVSTALLASSGTLGGVNTIATPYRVGIGAGPSTGTGTHVQVVRLGTTNTINAGSIELGGFNGSGSVNFQPGLTNPTLKIRAFDGVAAIGTLNVGVTNSGTRNGGGTLDLTGGSADILVNNLRIGYHFANASGTVDQSAINLAAGTISAGTLTMAEKSGTGTGLIQSFLNISGGTFTANTVIYGKGSSTSDVNMAPRPTINLSGGTFATASIAPDSGTATYSQANTVRTINLSGTGTLRNLNNSTDLLVSGKGTFDNTSLTFGNAITVRVPSGTPTVYADAGRTVTFAANVPIENSGGSVTFAGTLVKAGPGGLQINGSLNANSVANPVALKVDAGAIQVSNGSVPAKADVNARLIVDYTGTSVLPGVQSAIAAGYNAGLWDGATGFKSSLAASTTTAKMALGYAESSDLYGAGPTIVNALSVDNSAVVVRYTYAGDSNLDGTVDSIDFNKLVTGFGTTSAQWLGGDYNYDGVVDTVDFNLQIGNFGNVALGASALPGAAPGAVVPEPTTAALALLASAGLLGRRRR